MKNSKLIFFSILVLSTLLLLKKEESFQNKFAQLTLPIKESYLNLTNGIKGAIDTYLNQTESIKQLETENILLRKYLYQ